MTPQANPCCSSCSNPSKLPLRLLALRGAKLSTEALGALVGATAEPPHASGGASSSPAAAAADVPSALSLSLEELQLPRCDGARAQGAYCIT